jgi:hypothetical protein
MRRHSKDGLGVDSGVMRRGADRTFRVTYESLQCVEFDLSRLVKVVGCESREKCETCWPPGGLNTGYNKKARIRTRNKVFNSVYITSCSFCNNNTSAYTNPIEVCYTGKKEEIEKQK